MTNQCLYHNYVIAVQSRIGAYCIMLCVQNTVASMILYPIHTCVLSGMNSG